MVLFFFLFGQNWHLYNSLFFLKSIFLWSCLEMFCYYSSFKRYSQNATMLSSKRKNWMLYLSLFKHALFCGHANGFQENIAWRKHRRVWKVFLHFPYLTTQTKLQIINTSSFWLCLLEMVSNCTTACNLHFLVKTKKVAGSESWFISTIINGSMNAWICVCACVCMRGGGSFC